jgi:hypothetical protein
MEEIETNEREKPGLLRALYTLLYLIIGRFISMILLVIAITQYIYSWLTGEPNEKILHFTEDLAEYTKQLVSYVGFNTDEKPWPVGDWPDV